MDIKEMLIEDIGLSVRSIHALHRAGTRTVEDMLQWTEESLFTIRNLGAKSVAEILEKIEEYKEKINLSNPEVFEKWLASEKGKQYVWEYFVTKGTKIDVLELLSVRAYNVLLMNGYEFVHQVAFLSEEQLLEIPRMDRVCAVEIKRLTDHYIHEQKTDIVALFMESLIPEENPPIENFDDVEVVKSNLEWMFSPECREIVQRYIQEHDVPVESMGLTVRAKNCLTRAGYQNLSEIVFLSEEDFSKMRNMGAASIVNITERIDKYLTKHESHIQGYASGNISLLWSDDHIKTKILELYENAPFRGYSLSEYADALDLPEEIEIQRIKRIIGSLLADGKLEYVDFRCYRVYERFEEFLCSCSGIKDRSREFIQKKLDGMTLEAIGQEYDVTRERVRQVIKKDIAKVRNIYAADTGMNYFDEDYYQYLYETYSFDRETGEKWFGVPEAVWRYFELNDTVKGTRDLKEALEDRKIDAGLRLKIKNYLNRNRILLDGVWVERRRADIEDYVLKNLCTEDVAFDEFGETYNKFLQSQGVDFDESIYFTKDVYFTRKNRLVESKKVLWKLGEKLRYYDMESQDYTELLDVLNLDAYKNIQISTLKFIEDYPEVMEKYDIRDQYELHNLLKKTIPEGSFHDMKFERMPDIKFGTFDREEALVKLMKNNAPINADDLADLIHQEYGYDRKTIFGTHLQLLIGYYHDGVYGTELKEMPAHQMVLLEEQLQEDFYYIEEIRNLYSDLIPDGDPDNVNTYNLKKMGFQVLSTYAIKNHKNVEMFFETLLTKDDMADIAPYKRKFTYVPFFYITLMNLKKNLEIIEYEPNQVIHIRRLEQAGITKDAIRQFCEEAYDFIEDGTYFTAKSLREAGFQSELYDYGFSDWFYGNLLISDERFSFSRMFNSLVLYKGIKRISICDLLENRIQYHGSVDVLDLMTELEVVYGCKVDEKWDLVYKLENSEVYYDRYLERFYANEELFYHELDMMES